MGIRKLCWKMTLGIDAKMGPGYCCDFYGSQGKGE